LDTAADRSWSTWCSRAPSLAADRSAVVERYRELLRQGRDAHDAERAAFAAVLAAPGFEPRGDLYERFLAKSAPDARRRYGVYFTPPEVVSAQVRLVEDVLRSHLGCPHGFSDERVAIVDPATGGGAYPQAILALAPHATERMWLFESQPGAAALAHAAGLPAREADALKCELHLDAEVVVCIGNPPYRRQTATDTARQQLDGFLPTDGGIHRKNLYNNYVYFWRWALRTACERRPGPAVVCFVTASSYLRGPAFGGMRRQLRSAFDDIWLIDLEGDHRAARTSDNLFAIRTPIAIALCVRYAAAAATSPATVHFTRPGGSRADKLAHLARVRTVADFEWRPAEATWTGPLDAARSTAYTTWPALTDLFPWQLSGAQLKRTWPIGITAEVLRARWHRLLQLRAEDRTAAFGPSRDRDISSSPLDLFDPAKRLQALSQLPADAPCREPVRYAYRPFDRHWVLPDARCGDFMRPSLWRICGPEQIFLTSMLTNVLGPGPAAIATRLVPDLDHFRGSFGARAVIPLWCDADATVPNVNPAWLQRLSNYYGLNVRPLALMGYCYALLAAPSYTRRFEEELRTPGPRMPLTRDRALFSEASAAGEALIRLHTYQSMPRGQAHLQACIDGYPTAYAYDPVAENLRIGNALLGPVAPEVWAYAVSGYRVLNGWLRRRIARTPGRSPLDAITPRGWSNALSDELLQLVWLLEATLAQYASLDAVLAEVTSGDLVVE
jgi:type ISP restriction-modification system protein/N-6 DNA methylase